MYVDESGDTGLPSSGSPTRYFCLSGLVVHESNWTESLKSLKQFRYWLKGKYGIYLEEELHAAELIRGDKSIGPSLLKLRKHERLAIVRHHADQIAKLDKVRLLSVCLDKELIDAQSSDDVFRKSWYALFQRFENTIRRGNFVGPKEASERGMVFPDQTDAKRLRQYLDEMRMRNPLITRGVAGQKFSRDEPIRVLIEDPVCRDSRDSYFMQAVDCAVFLLKQHIEPNGHMKRHGGNAYFSGRLGPVLCRQASNSSQLGIVTLPTRG